MKCGSLFSGIGGIDLGLERAGIEIVWQCEKDPWCRGILRQHWPGVPIFEDVWHLDERTPRVDLLAGGFPCQPSSQAGQRREDFQDDDRWLWPGYERAVRILRPRYVLVENVPDLLIRGFESVLGSLAALGYDAEWQSLPAGAFGAPHIRDRIFLVAYTDREPAGGHTGGVSEEEVEGRAGAAQANGSQNGRRNGRGNAGNRRAGSVRASAAGGVSAGPGGGAVLHAAGSGWRHETRCVFPSKTSRGWETSLAHGASWWEAEPDVGRVADGFPGRVDRIRGLGNAVVPQVAEWVGRLIVAHSLPERGTDGVA